MPHARATSSASAHLQRFTTTVPTEYSDSVEAIDNFTPAVILNMQISTTLNFQKSPHIPQFVTS